MTPPREHQNMIHSHNPSVPSPTAIEASEQTSVGAVSNQRRTSWIYSSTFSRRPTRLVASGPIEKDSWKDEHFPDCRLRLVGNTLEKDSAEYKKTNARKLT